MKPVSYTHLEHGELEQYRASNNANLQCKEAIEAAVREHFDGMYLSRDAAKGVIETYGMDPVSYTHLDVYKRQGQRHPGQTGRTEPAL